MSYEAVGMLPNGAQIGLRIPLLLLGIVGLVLALNGSRRLGSRGAMLAAAGSAAFALDAILDIIWIALTSRIYTSPSVGTFLDLFTVLDVVLIGVAMALLIAAFSVRRPGDAASPAPGAPQVPNYGGYPGSPYSPPGQPQPPYAPAAWPNQGSSQPPVYSQPPGYPQQPGYPQPPSQHAPSYPQPPSPPHPSGYPQQPSPPQPPTFAPPAEAPNHHVTSAPPHSPYSPPPEPPPHSAPPAHHS
jgi:hypothetical protein